MMEARVVRRWHWLAGGALALAGIGVGVTLAPRVARDMDTFRVAQVEVLGTRFLEPYAVVRAAGLDGAANVFDDAAEWRRGVLALPLVADATVRRRLPATVRIEVREVEPVALVSADRLRPVDGTGRIVDLEPAGTVLDLPILVGVPVDSGAVAPDPGGAALRLLASLREQQRFLADRLSQMEVVDDWVRLVFRDDGPEALLPLEATPAQLLQLRLAYADLAARGELRQTRRIDVRFRDQVVVSFLRRRVS